MFRSLSGKLVLFIFTVLFVISCADENPNLVNPESQAETIFIRLVNYGGDNKARLLDVDGTKTDETAYGRCSPAIHPPADSAIVSILLNNVKEIELKRWPPFSRDIVYTYIGLPSADGAPQYRPLDTLIKVTTSSSIPENTIDAFIKMFNANPDSTIKYSLKQGCPNGPFLISNLNYRRSSTLTQVRSGSVAVSLIRHERDGQQTNLGLFKLDLEPRQQYLLIVSRNISGEDEFQILEQRDYTESAMSPVVEIMEQFTSIRTINLSSVPISLIKAPDESVNNNVQPDFAADFTDVSACASNSLDTLIAYDENVSSTFSKVPVSLEVLRNYSVMVFDSADRKASHMLVAGPVYLNESAGTRAIVRVVHGAYDKQSITLSLGARKHDNLDSGYVSGEVIANKLNYMEISEPVFVEPGLAPLFMFTSFEPARLLYNTSTFFEPGRQYFLIISNDSDGNDRMTLVLDEVGAPPSALEYFDPGVFIQLVHSVSGREKISIDFGNLLEDANLFFGSALATIADEGSQSISIDQVPVNFSATKDQRVLIVAAGDNNSPKQFSYISDPMGATYSEMHVRFINLSEELSEITISTDTSKAPLLENLKYGDVSNTEVVLLEKKASYYFIDAIADTVSLRVDDIFLPFGTNNTIIFTGTSVLGFNAIVQQEF